MIEVKDVSLSYVKNLKVIDNINFKVDDGTVFGFIGPNGAGKTTTIEMITGVLNIDEGDIFIDEKSIKNNPLEAKKQFGFVPDSPDVFEKLTGIEYLNFIGDIYDVPEKVRLEKVKKLSEEFGISKFLKDRIQSYSHGMRQKLLVIAAMLHSPKILILDEPMTGLDPKASHDLKEMMKKYKEEGNIIFFSTHILEVAEKLCDRIGIINKGELVFVGSCDEMKEKFKDNGSLEELFLEITQ